MAQRLGNLTIENTRIMFRNFAGKEGPYNASGVRSFAVPLDVELATKMIEDGWNVKQLKAREEGEAPQDYISVAVSYNPKARPPRIVLVTSRGRTTLTENEIDILDFADIENVDLIINPSQWSVQGKSGIKAYLQSIFVTIREDELERKYADVPEAGAAVNDDGDDNG